MFLSKSVILLGRTSALRASAPRLIAARSLTIGGTFGKKEKVEEDRFMRELEAKYIENKKAEKASQMATEEEKEFNEVVAPAMAEAQVLISKNGDSISQDALEALARWKLGL